MTARFTVALAAFLTATAFAPAPFPRPPRRGGPEPVSLAALQGVWRVASFEATRGDGDRRPHQWHIQYIRIRGERWTFMNRLDSDNVSYLIAVNGRVKPAAIDFLHADQASGRPCGVGILRRLEDKVQIVYSFNPSGRAADFERPPTGQWLLLLERQR